MRILNAKSARGWTVYALLFAALIYAALALRSEPVYASSCDCVTAEENAFNACVPHGGLYDFTCPVGAFYYYRCSDNYQTYMPCP